MEKLIELLNEYGNERYDHWGDYQTDMDQNGKTYRVIEWVWKWGSRCQY